MSFSRFSPSHSNFRCPGIGYRFRQQVAAAFLSLVGIVAFGQAANAANGTWITDGNGLWSDTANWSGGTVADGSGFTADFNTVNITATRTVSLDSARTIGNLVFGDITTSSAASWVLDNNGNAANVLTLAGTTPTITVNALGTNATTSISAIIAGSDGLTKAGSGVLVLSGANTYTGGTTINAGSLRAQNNSALGTGTVTVASGARLQLHGANLSNTININGSNALFTNSGTNNVLSGTVNLQSNSTVSMNSANNNSLNFSGSLNLGSNTLTVSTTNGSPVTISGAISGSGGITKSNDGTLTINGNNTATYSGTTTLQRGTIAIGNNAALGTGTLALTVNNDISGTIRSTDTTARTVANAVSISGGNSNTSVNFGSTNSSLNGNLTFTGNVILNGSRRFTVHNTTQFDGTITDALAGVPLTPVVSGFSILTGSTGTVILNGANTYSGTTTINAGRLLVNNTSGSGTGTGAVTVNSGGTLGGGNLAGTAGFISGLVNVASGGHLAPGNSAGTLTLSGGLTLAATGGSILDFELGSISGSDLLKITAGAFTGNSSGSTTVNITELGGFGAGTYTLIDWNGATASGVDLSDFLLSSGTFSGGLTGSLLISGNELQLSVVPEPATFTMLLAGVGMMAVVRRRRKATV